MPFDKTEFFKKQIEECRELERQAINAEDRAFWQQAAGRWEEQIRQAQEAQRRKKQYPTLAATSGQSRNSDTA